jgi:predicted DNA-binding transcriptional regulator YafY
VSTQTVPVIQPRVTVKVWYTNWKGERALRTITPLRVFYGSNQWHPEPQWLLEARDEDKQDLRTFSFAGLGLGLGKNSN